MKYKVSVLKEFNVLSGDLDVNVVARNQEEAIVEALIGQDLTICSQFIQVRDLSAKKNDPNWPKWGLIELYLKRAGFKKLDEHRWKAEVV